MGPAAAAFTSKASSNCLMNSDSSKERHLLVLVEQLVRAHLRHRLLLSFCVRLSQVLRLVALRVLRRPPAALTATPAPLPAPSLLPPAPARRPPPPRYRAAITMTAGESVAGASSTTELSGTFSLYASSSERNFDCAETNKQAARDISPFSSPAIFESMTSLGIEVRESFGLVGRQDLALHVAALEDQGGELLRGVHDLLGRRHGIAGDERDRGRPFEQGLQILDRRIGRRPLHQACSSPRRTSCRPRQGTGGAR